MEKNQWKNSGSNYSLFPNLLQGNTQTETNGKAVASPQSLKNPSFLTFRLNLNSNPRQFGDGSWLSVFKWFLAAVLHYHYFASCGMELILHYPWYLGREQWDVSRTKQSKRTSLHQACAPRREKKGQQLCSVFRFQQGLMRAGTHIKPHAVLCQSIGFWKDKDNSPETFTNWLCFPFFFHSQLQDA